jgi:hypothetical protein
LRGNERTISPGFAGLAHAGHIQAEAIYDYAEALCQAAGTTMAKLSLVRT